MKPLELMEQGRFLGEEFLLWLWMRSMTEGGASGEDGDGSGCFVDDAIQLVSERGEVKVELLRKVLPSPKVVEVAWDLKGGILWTTASSSKAQGALTSLFIKSFGCEVHPLAPLVLSGRLCPDLSVESLMALDPLDLELEEV